MKNVTALILFLVLIIPDALSQDYALFIHGFEGSEESWLESGTPDDWVSAGIITDYVLLNYETDDLTTPAGQASLIQQIATKMGQKDPAGTGQWIIVGHSMGGLIARSGYHELANNPLTDHFDIVGILTAATPHQGARATHVSLGNFGGYTNVQPVLDEFIDLTTEPLPYVHDTIAELTNLHSPDALDQIDAVPDLISNAIDSLEVYESASVANDLKSIIGLNGSLIQEINSGQLDEPAHKRSVFGSEKRFITVRTANELSNEGGNEMTALSNFDDIRYFYRVNADAWHLQQIVDTIKLKFPSAKSSRRKRDRWNRGRNALDNIDGYWGEMIDSYTIDMVQIREYYEVECEEGGSGEPSQPGTFPEEGEEPICWDFHNITVPMTVGTKNDVIIGPDYAVWNPNEDPDVLNGTNFYYDDVPADGGYNHFEIRRYKRGYELPGVFVQNELSPPMRQAAEWLGIEVFN